MKNPYVIKTIGLGSVLALAISLGTSAFAGPGPQYWAQMEQIRAENAAKAKAKAAVPAAKPADTPSMACAQCKTTAVTEYRPSGFEPKIFGRLVQVGTKHSCGGCTGSLTSVRGKLTDKMKRTCPICASADPKCCSVST